MRPFVSSLLLLVALCACQDKERLVATIKESGASTQGDGGTGGIASEDGSGGESGASGGIGGGGTGGSGGEVGGGGGFNPCSTQERRLVDNDGDGYGDPNNYEMVGVCEPWEEGYVNWIEGRDDCNDNDSTIHPLDDGSCGTTVCAFSVWNGDWNEDGTQKFVTTFVAPRYTLLSSPVVVASAGEDVTVDFAVTSQNECGPINYHFFNFFVWSYDATWNWTGDIAYDGALSSLERRDTTSFGDSSGSINTPKDPNVRYCWTDRLLLEGCPGTIPTQTIEDEVIYRFTWKQTTYPPPGSHLKIELTLGGWTDPTTEERIIDFTTATAFSVDLTIN